MSRPLESHRFRKSSWSVENRAQMAANFILGMKKVTWMRGRRELDKEHLAALIIKAGKGISATSVDPTECSYRSLITWLTCRGAAHDTVDLGARQYTAIIQLSRRER